MKISFIRRKRAIVVLGIFLWGSCAFAQDVEIERIVVTPSGIEQPVEDTARKMDIISNEEIDSFPLRDAAQQLTTIPSVNISSYGGPGAAKTIRMRGSTASQVLVMVDGRPVNSSRDGEVDLSALSLLDIDRIELVHGPGSSRYGSSAMGGVINFLTEDPPEKMRTSISSSFGTFRSYLERLSHGNTVGKFGYLLNAEYDKSEGARANSDYEAKNFSTKLTYELSQDQHMEANIGYNRSRVGAPGLVTSPDEDDYQRWTKYFVDLTWEGRLAENTGILMKTFSAQDRLSFYEETAGSMWDSAFAVFTHQTVSRGVNLQVDQAFGDWDRIIAGTQVTGNKNDSTSSAKHDYSVWAGYLENQWTPTEDWNVSVSARVDDYSNFGTEVSPGAGVLFHATEKVSARASVNRSFRAPTFNDLYWPDEGWIKGNPDVQPEQGLTYEIGVDIQPVSFLQGDVTYFYSDYSDLINWVDVGGVWQPVNINVAQIQGVEWGSRWLMSEDWSVRLGHTFQIPRDGETNTDIVYQPRHKLNFSLNCEDLWGVKWALRGEWIGARYHDPANSTKLEPVFVMGMDAVRRISETLEVFANMDNMLNHDYEMLKDYPMPGFSIRGGVTVEF